MTYPFLACLLLAGIHVYLGIHVISRKVIFVDLALGQIAALGTVYGVLLGYGLREDPWVIKGFSLAFAVAGAAIFSLTRMRHERVPHEAIIGITYAVALATTILASSRLPHGAEEINALLAGSILWVEAHTIFYMAILYACIGVFHYLFRKRFLQLSLDPEGAEREGVNTRWWDFLFYLSFGFVVTSSVSVAGVLLVFSYLVVPAVIAALFADSVRARLAIGWLVGCLVSFLGVTVSYFSDLPSGPTIVVTFALCLAACGVVYYMMHAPSAKGALLRIGAGGLVVAALFASSRGLGKDEHRDAAEMLESSIRNERLIALRGAEESVGSPEELSSVLKGRLADADAEVRVAALELVQRVHATDLLGEVHELLTDEDDLVREAALGCVKEFHDASSIDPLMDVLATEQDEFLKTEVAALVSELGDARGLLALIDIMDSGEVSQVRADACDALRAGTALAFDFDAELAAESNDAAMVPFREWWSENGGSLRWQAATHTFTAPAP